MAFDQQQFDQWALKHPERARRTEQAAIDLTDALAALLDTGQLDAWNAFTSKCDKRPQMLAVCHTTGVAWLGLTCHKQAQTITALEQRLAVLERRPEFKYCGVWSGSERYHPGSFVTHAGSLWACKVEHVSRRPGIGDGSWQLAVKSGQCRCRPERSEVAS
jgi:hypothetical protein